MEITTIGIDLAKNVVQAHGVDKRGNTVLRKQLRRDQVAAFFANLPACLIGMEACGSAHHWARKLQAMGHTVKLMAPQFVKPYVKSNKNDAADAEAICEAVARPSMRFVPVEHLQLLHRQVEEIEARIKAWHRDSEASQRLEKVPGIGPLTATAVVATIGDAKNFDNGRQLAAWLGLVPRQHSSGGKQNLLGMSKRGDAYLRTMLIHGARSVIYRAMQKADPRSWVFNVAARRNKNVAAVALANKTARTSWALLLHDREFRADYAAA
jgi:transposase